MDNSYGDKKSYGMDDSYGNSDYRDNKDKKYDSYGPPVYGMDIATTIRNHMEWMTAMRKSDYGNDNSYDKSQYQSYKPDDYKPQYQSYDEKDDSRDKSSKDSKKSVSINKLKCINNNLNINGNNTGNVSIGNKGAAEGYLGTYSSDGGGYGGDDGYDSKQGKGFECIINNNNNNTNIVVGGGGNVTDGGGNHISSPCEECFERLLNDSELAQVELRLAPGLTLSYGPNQQITFNSLATLCERF